MPPESEKRRDEERPDEVRLVAMTRADFEDATGFGVPIGTCDRITDAWESGITAEEAASAVQHILADHVVNGDYQDECAACRAQYKLRSAFTDGASHAEERS